MTLNSSHPSPADQGLFYLTTAIDYLTGAPHLGHLYEKLLADTLVRYQRLAGRKTYFVMGTDEHGERIAKLAEQAGITPQAFVDQLSQAAFSDLWDSMGISHDDFIRTTQERHTSFVRHVLQQVYDSGDIYFAEYEGLYSLGAERYVTEKELVEGPDGIWRFPGDKDPPERRKEANYFLRLEKYRPWLLEYLQAHPKWIQPTAYRNEVLEMLSEPMDDLSISRPKERVSWGIELPWDSGHVTYVWFDALLNYISAPVSKGLPSDIIAQAWHVIGKDILKPHAVFWPIMLKVAGFPLYQRLVVHAHILAEDGRKMGKSLGNALDPRDVVRSYDLDTIRYTLMRDISMSADGPFGPSTLMHRLNNDLANDLGNLLARTVSMVSKYRGGVVPAPHDGGAREQVIWQTAKQLPNEVLRLVDELKVNMAVDAAMSFVRDLNRYIAESEPWALAKKPECAAQLDTVLYTAIEGLRVASVALEPVLPQKALELRAQLGLAGQSYRLEPEWGLTPAGTQVQGGAILFPKLEAPKLEAPAPTDPSSTASQSTRKDQHTMSNETTTPESTPAATPTPAPAEAKPAQAEGAQGSQSSQISIDDFAKIDLRIVEVLHAEAVEKADKLLKLVVKLGDEERTVVSGIRKWFAPEDLIGRKVVLVANLKPAKLRGIESHGMILAAEDAEGRLDLLGTQLDLPTGTRVR